MRHRPSVLRIPPPRKEWLKAPLLVRNGRAVAFMEPFPGRMAVAPDCGGYGVKYSSPTSAGHASLLSYCGLSAVGFAVIAL